MPGRQRTPAHGLALTLVALSLTLPTLLTSSAPLVNDGPFLAWHTETIDNVASPWMDTAIVLDSNGVPHTLHGRGYTGTVHATIQNGAWTLTFLDHPQGGAGDLTIDQQDTLHAAYISQNNIYYATNPGGTWTYEYAAPAAWNARINLNPLTGQPEIAYGHGQQGLTYATRTTNGWTIQHIDNSGDLTAVDIDATIDTNGIPHIAYRAGEDHGYTTLMYATQVNDQWTTTLVDTECGNQGISLDIDTQNRPHIACHDYTRGLRYLTWNGNTWDSELVDNADDLVWDRPDHRAGFEPSLQLDSEDQPHIAYEYLYGLSQYNPGVWGQLHYATRSPLGWHNEVIDHTGVDTGRNPSLTLDANDQPHLSYTFARRHDGCALATNTCFDLKYATPATALPEALAARALTTLP